MEHADHITFGLFELDVHAGELWKAGHKVRLSGQPLKVLVVLLGRPGEVVTREDLQTKVWGSNVNVDFERAVAGAVNKIREALGDSADNPRFVQTLPKRGYRFIAPVHFVAAAVTKDLPQQNVGDTPAPQDAVATEAAVPLTPMASAPVGLAAAIDAQRVPTAPASVSRSVVWYVALVAGLVLALCFAVWMAWRSSQDAAPLRVEQVTHGGAISTGPPSQENLLTLATDGDRILTSVVQDGQPRLSSISIGTGAVEGLPLPQELAQSVLADVSKDGTRLLLRSHASSASEQPIWIVPSTGGSAFRVGNVLAHDAAWMPDSESVLYANGNDLAVIRPDNGNSTPFAHLDGRVFWMRWSPDGKVMRCTLLNPVTHSSEIWELQSNGTQARRLQIPSAKYSWACCGTWTADGSAFVFESGDNLWQLQGGRFRAVIQLTNGPLRFLSPATARAGTRVFFLGLDHPLGMQLFAAGQASHAAPAFLANATRVTYSRDGIWVAWTDNDEKLWRARAADGSDKVRLTPGYLEVFMAHWSPDSKRLAIMAREPGKVWRLYLIDSGGGAPEPLLNESRNAADPDWSHDGQSLVFGRESDRMGKESGPHTIQTVNLNSMKTDVLPGSEGLFSPRWSPDGRWIVALTLNQKSVMLYDVAQQRWRELAATSASDPVWSPDSRSVYVNAYLEPQQPILKIGIADGIPHVVADLGGLHDQNIVNYFFGGITPAGEPLIQPRIGTGDIFTLDLHVR